MIPVLAESVFLAASVVEIKETVTVEPFVNGFSDAAYPDDGFTVIFE